MQKMAILIAACLVASAVSAAAQTAGFSGDADYRNYCAACHGTNAKGDGPIAASMRKHPTDLTQLAKQNGGTFPAERVAQTIDGRKPVSGHGTPDMPVWGDVFSKSSASTTPEAVKERIDALVKYLERIQQKS